MLNHVQGIVTLALAGKALTDDENQRKISDNLTNAKIAISQERLSSILHLSNDFSDSVYRIFDVERMEVKDIYSLMSTFAKHAANDLHIKRHDFITSLAAGEIQLLNKQLEAMEES